MAQYHRGRVTEYEVMRMLRDAGYDVIRAASSKGRYDVIAFDREGQRDTRLISVKRSGKEEYCRDTLTSEIKRLGAITVPPHHMQEVWIWLDGRGWYTRQAVIG